MQTKELFILAGPNGAGKTTAAFKLLPDFLKVSEYVNADSIAAGLSPFQPAAVAIEAGRLMLNRINTLAAENKNFAFETTLASKTFCKLIHECKRKGYKTNLMFLWLQNVELAIERVKLRVLQGGHSIPPEDIKRRYKRGLDNLFSLYMPIIDNWWVYNNSNNNPDVICKKLSGQSIEVLKLHEWNICKTSHEIAP